MDDGGDDAEESKASRPPLAAHEGGQWYRDVNDFVCREKVGEGTFGRVYLATDKRSGETVALKRLAEPAGAATGLPMTSLREMRLLAQLRHDNILPLYCVAVGEQRSKVYLVLRYCEHDLAALLTAGRRFSLPQTKCLLQQLLSGVAYLHANYVMHRDLKPSNLLYSGCGRLMIADFGLARQFGRPARPYTQRVVTLWYRAPELLLGAKKYSEAIDMWAVGAIMAELLLGEPLWAGRGDMQQLLLILRTLGCPSEADCPRLWASGLSIDSLPRGLALPPALAALSPAGRRLLLGLLDMNDGRRLTAAEALQSSFFTERPLPQTAALMPSFRGAYDEPRQRSRSRPAEEDARPVKKRRRL